MNKNSKSLAMTKSHPGPPRNLSKKWEYRRHWIAPIIEEELTRQVIGIGQLSQCSGISRSVILRFLSGHYVNIRLSTIESLLDALNLDLEVFDARRGNPTATRDEGSNQ